MMNSPVRFLLHCLIGAAVLLSVACTTAPVQEMSDARQAIAAARDADAARRTPRLLNSAEQSMLEAQQQLNNYFYTEARKRAIAAKAQAVTARQEAEAQRHAERKRAARTAIDEAQHALQDAIALEAAWLTSADILKTAEAAFNSGDYAEAQIRAADAEQQALKASNTAYLEKARLLIEVAKSKRHLSSAHRSALKAAEKAFQNGDGKQAFLLINRLL